MHFDLLSTETIFLQPLNILFILLWQNMTLNQFFYNIGDTNTNSTYISYFYYV